MIPRNVFADWRKLAVLGLAVAILATTGGVVTASNLGFKINKQIFNGFLAADAPKRDNWISLPYNNPYPTGPTLCAALGMNLFTQTVSVLNPTTGTFVTANGEPGFLFRCNSAVATAIPSNKGIQVRNPSTTPAPPTSAILVGSSNETTPLPTIYGSFAAAKAPLKDNWISVPYHTTWVKASDVCQSVGLTTFGSGAIIRINADPAAVPTTSTHNCPGAAGTGFSLVIGEAILIRKNTAGDSAGILPPHF